jgi:hypothetical protein
MKRGSIAYGHYWWYYERVDIRRKVYGINRDGDKTKVFGSIAEGMRSFGEEDKCKGICTSIKWGVYWRGYRWYYADIEQAQG